MLNGFDVEADGRYGRHDLTELEFVEDGGLPCRVEALGWGERKVEVEVMCKADRKKEEGRRCINLLGNKNVHGISTPAK